MQYNDGFKIGSNQIGIRHPTYFIADIAANHDGSLERAKNLIYLAKEAGSHCDNAAPSTTAHLAGDLFGEAPRAHQIDT